MTQYLKLSALTGQATGSQPKAETEETRKDRASEPRTAERSGETRRSAPDKAEIL